MTCKELNNLPNWMTGLGYTREDVFEARKKSLKYISGIKKKQITDVMRTLNSLYGETVHIYIYEDFPTIDIFIDGEYYDLNCLEVTHIGAYNSPVSIRKLFDDVVEKLTWCLMS